ncbi:hypothetical protein GCM10023150_12630 [Kangiella taiwanensis]|uniref:Formyl transferase N-terminal domain-containing protein n=2 Tax=Kangiella taiwanensis TaxID=1079179 RepID=A0ABP8I0I7_9GAMM
MPSFWVLKNREKQTGVSVFFVDEGIDSGPILVQKNIVITKPNLEDLIIKSKKVGMMAICEAVDLINRGNYKCIPNNDDEMTYFHFPSKSDVKEFIQNGAKFY